MLGGKAAEIELTALPAQRSKRQLLERDLCAATNPRKPRPMASRLSRIESYYRAQVTDRAISGLIIGFVNVAE